MAYHQQFVNANTTLASHFSVAAAPMISMPRAGSYAPCTSSNSFSSSDMCRQALNLLDMREQPPPYSERDAEHSHGRGASMVECSRTSASIPRRPLPPIPQPVITEMRREPQQASPASSPVRSPAESPTADYRPTSKPTHGRPLLNGGHVLVFPEGHERCTKCRDTGYKLSHPYDHKPCDKCWQKYGRPFTGPLTFSADFSPDAPYRDTLQQPIYWNPCSPRPVHHASQPAGGNAIASGSGSKADNVFAHPDWGRRGKCKKCKGHGLVYVLSIGDACPACRGAGSTVNSM